MEEQVFELEDEKEMALWNDDFGAAAYISAIIEMVEAQEAVN